MADMTKDIQPLDATMARLRQSEPILTDGDFTATVITQLVPTKELPVWISNGILLGATALGSAILAWQIPLAAPASLFNAATANLPAVLIAAVVFTYGGALVALWATDQ
jgi:hypothetical protein